MVIVWTLRGNIIRTALCWIVWHNVHSPQHTYMSSSYRSNRLGLSHWDPYTVCRGGCLELCYCNMVEWFWWDLSLILTTNWFPSVLWHCWFGHLACKNRPWNDLLCVELDVKPYSVCLSIVWKRECDLNACQLLSHILSLVAVTGVDCYSFCSSLGDWADWTFTTGMCLIIDTIIFRHASPHALTCVHADITV